MLITDRYFIIGKTLVVVVAKGAFLHDIFASFHFLRPSPNHHIYTASGATSLLRQHFPKSLNLGFSPGELQLELVSLIGNMSQCGFQVRDSIEPFLAVFPRSHGITLTLDSHLGLFAIWIQILGRRSRILAF